MWRSEVSNDPDLTLNRLFPITDYHGTRSHTLSRYEFQIQKFLGDLHGEFLEDWRGLFGHLNYRKRKSLLYTENLKLMSSKFWCCFFQVL
ncbi:hypothetical protein L1887_32651 [Cichorium endivia]|nr:hypothetical protein L1887_32651 [Cichorium endivia]